MAESTEPCAVMRMTSQWGRRRRAVCSTSKPPRRQPKIAQEQIEAHVLQALQGGLAVQKRFDLVLGFLGQAALDLAADDGFVVDDSDPEALHSLSPQ